MWKYSAKNDYNRYELNIESDKLGRVKITEHVPEFAGAVFGESIEYSFIGFVEE